MISPILATVDPSFRYRCKLIQLWWKWRKCQTQVKQKKTCKRRHRIKKDNAGKCKNILFEVYRSDRKSSLFKLLLFFPSVFNSATDHLLFVLSPKPFFGALNHNRNDRSIFSAIKWNQTIDRTWSSESEVHAKYTECWAQQRKQIQHWTSNNRQNQAH